MGNSKQDPKKTVIDQPLLTTEARLVRLQEAALTLAEERILNGTASNQLIIKCLEYRPELEKAERELKATQAELAKAKAENLQSAKRTEELYEKVISSVRVYMGVADDGEDI